MKKKDLNKIISKHCFYAVYDLAVSPVTFEVLSFLISAEMERLHSGKSDLVLIIIHDRNEAIRKLGYSANYFKAKETINRLQGIIIPASQLLANCKNVHVFETRNQAKEFLQRIDKYQIFPENYDINKPVAAFTMAGVAARNIANYPSATLNATQVTLDSVGTWLKSMVPKNKQIISITLREANYGDVKNSDLKQWSIISNYLKKEGFFVIIIRDNSRAMEPLDEIFGEVLTYPAASIDLNIRCAFYESCLLNLVGQNGPMSLCFLNNNINCLAFLEVNANWHDATSRSIRCSFGIEVGDQAYFLDQSNEIFWENKDTDKMLGAIIKMVAKLAVVRKSSFNNERGGSQELPFKFLDRMINERQWGPARVVARMLHKKQPDNINYTHQLGLSEIWQGNIDRGLTYFKKAQKLGLENSNLYVSFGEAYIFLGQHARAVANFHLALNLDPKNIQAHVKAAICFEALGQVQSGIELLDKALELNPKDISVQKLRSYLLLKLSS